MPVPQQPHVVIVGGGFAGLYAARQLGGKPVRVTLVDRKNHHTFQPLLYQVALAVLSPAQIASPIRGVLGRHRNIEVLLGEVTRIELAQRRIILDGDTPLDYDYLLLAAGATHSYFGNDQWEKVAPGLKTMEDALEIRKRVLLAFELAERRAVLERKQPPLNFVVVGAGPTGVELAGAISDIARIVLRNDFRAIDPRQTRVLLLEGGPRVLPAYPEDLSRSAERQLRQLEVEVRTNAKVTDVRPGEVHIGDEIVPSLVTLWAAGVQASPLARCMNVPLDKAGRVEVTEDLSVPGHANVMVLGDLAAITNPDGKPVPGVAPAAIQMGKAAAANILRDLKGQPRQRFVYRDKGSLATIGRKSAVADFGRLRFGGLPAWVAWLVIHLFFLIGFRNRMLVLTEWAWSYFTAYRGARLITGVEVLPGVGEVKETVKR